MVSMISLVFFFFCKCTGKNCHVKIKNFVSNGGNGEIFHLNSPKFRS
jgi:hypothetical protein